MKPTRQNKINYAQEAFETGCYFDGAFGQEYNNQRLVSLAVSFGFEIPEYIVDPENDYELQDEIQNEAVDYLNELEEREGFYWSWHEGDFFLFNPETDPYEKEV